MFVVGVTTCSRMFCRYRLADRPSDGLCHMMLLPGIFFSRMMSLPWIFFFPVMLLPFFCHSYSYSAHFNCPFSATRILIPLTFTALFSPLVFLFPRLLLHCFCFCCSIILVDYIWVLFVFLLFCCTVSDFSGSFFREFSATSREWAGDELVGAKSRALRLDGGRFRQQVDIFVFANSFALVFCVSVLFIKRAWVPGGLVGLAANKQGFEDFE